MSNFFSKLIYKEKEDVAVPENAESKNIRLSNNESVDEVFSSTIKQKTIVDIANGQWTQVEEIWNSLSTIADEKIRLTTMLNVLKSTGMIPSIIIDESTSILNNLQMLQKSVMETNTNEIKQANDIINSCNIQIENAKMRIEKSTIAINDNKNMVEDIASRINTICTQLKSGNGGN